MLFVFKVFFSVMTGSMNFGISSPYIEAFGVAKAAGSKVFQIIDNIPIINLSKGKGEKIDDLKGKIVFKDVEFLYPSRKDVPVSIFFNLIFVYVHIKDEH
jgi:ATP-binding cassette subfamily B (MDR/TAP) protein 1